MPTFLAPILFGPTGDTNLYRSAAHELKTDDNFKVGPYFSVNASSGLTTVDGNFYAQRGGAAELRLGALGPASESAVVFGSALDTNLYRSAADTLKTDDSLVVGGSLTVGVGGGATKGLLRQAYR